jgi:hypothetical protein
MFKKEIVILIEFMLLLGAFFVAIFVFKGVSKDFISLKQKELDEKIAFDCAQTYRFTQTLKNGTVVSYPMEREYKDCVSSR